MLSNFRVAPELGGDAAAALGKSTPAVAVSAAAIAGVPLEQWAIILTIVYLVLQIAYLAWKWVREWQGKRSSNDA